MYAHYHKSYKYECMCVLCQCRYVNGADPNRRRLSYKGMAEGVAMPLKHWHLLEGGWLKWLAGWLDVARGLMPTIRTILWSAHHMDG